MTSINEYRALFWQSDALYNSVMEQSGMPTSEYMTLYCISKGLNTQSAICKKLYMPKQTINSAVKKFEKEGIISLCPTPDNDKLKTLALTKKGEALVREKVLAMDRVEEAVWLALSEEEQDKLVEITSKYNEILKDKVAVFLKNSAE